MTLSFDIIAGNNANWGFDAFSFAPELTTAPSPAVENGSRRQGHRLSDSGWATPATATTAAAAAAATAAAAPRRLSASQQSIAGANAALNENEENISSMKNDALYVTLQTSDPAVRAFDSNLYVASLPDWFTDADLYELFQRFGPILSAKVMCHKGTHHCKGYGFVLFQRTEDAAVARSEMIGHVVGGNKIQVRRARSAASAPLGDCGATSSATAVSGVAAFADVPRATLPTQAKAAALNASPPFLASPPQPLPALYSTTPTYVVTNGSEVVNGAYQNSSNSDGTNASNNSGSGPAMFVAVPNGRGVVQGPDNVVYMLLTSPQLQASNVIF
ncbi:RNA-binding protein 5-like protein [Lotmaria passim]